MLGRVAFLRILNNLLKQKLPIIKLFSSNEIFKQSSKFSTSFSKNNISGSKLKKRTSTSNFAKFELV